MASQYPSAQPRRRLSARSSQERLSSARSASETPFVTPVLELDPGIEVGLAHEFEQPPVDWVAPGAQQGGGAEVEQHGLAAGVDHQVGLALEIAVGDAAGVHGADGLQQLIEEFRADSRIAEGAGVNEVQDQKAVLDQAVANRYAGQALESQVGLVFAPERMSIDGQQRSASGGRLHGQLPVVGVQPVDSALIAARHLDRIGQ